MNDNGVSFTLFIAVPSPTISAKQRRPFPNVFADCINRFTIGNSSLLLDPYYMIESMEIIAM